MSNSPEINLDLDLHFLPAWAQESATVNRYAGYAGESERRSFGGEGRPPRRDGPRRPDRPQRRDGVRPEGGRPQGSGGGPRRQDDRGPGRGGPGQRGPSFGRDRGFREERPAVVMPELRLELYPDEAGVDSLARQIKLTGRAYPIFEIAHLILRKPERYQLVFQTLKKPGGELAQGLWTCNLDESVWMAEADAVRHVLAKHFDTFYQTEKIAAEAPKGTYTFVAQCGISGVILGPPNYHDYQNKLHKLHQERFARMPFDVFKSRVKIVRDEAVVKQWVEEQSWKLEFNCLNVPEPRKLTSRDEVEQHFREVHLANIIQPVDKLVVSNPRLRELLPGPMQALARRTLDEQRRFPIQVVHSLSQQFSKRSLQFFKVNKSVTHVCIARPHFLDLEASPVSEGVRKIVEFINAHPKCTRKHLIEALAPVSTATPAREESAPAPAEGTPAADTPSPEAAAAPPANPVVEALIRDLRWLVYEGHAIEFASGELDTAKKPAPKPPKPEPAKAAGAAPAEAKGAAAKEGEVASATVPTAEGTPPADHTADPAPSSPDVPPAETAVPSQEPPPVV